MKQKVLSIFVLLCLTAVMAQATENSIVINGTPQVGDNSISLTYYFDPARHMIYALPIITEVG